MSRVEKTMDVALSSQAKTAAFTHLVVIEPLGFLYGSTGKFLSPENLVGRSGSNFPPSAAVVSGLFAAAYEGDMSVLEPLQLAGPFWAKNENPQNFYVPTPFNYLVKNLVVQDILRWSNDGQDTTRKWKSTVADKAIDKFEKGTWVEINQWGNITLNTAVSLPSWRYNPHLHPRLRQDQRIVEQDADRGSLFLENAVQLDPDACLVYLSNTEIQAGWYRFGGEGHMVDVRCVELSADLVNLLQQPVGQSFALITPAVWGSNRLSCREPISLNKGQPKSNESKVWSVAALMTERPIPFRYRLGNRETDDPEPRKGVPKLLSRGRYAVPAGTVYVVNDSLPAWQDWDTAWFPKEGPSLKRWGCGLALPLSNAT
jgi:CRISPR-associated protein Cmr3